MKAALSHESMGRGRRRAARVRSKVLNGIAAASLTALALAAGCATTDRKTVSEDAAAATAADTASPARVEVQPDVGFTVTEIAPMSVAARADYLEAIALLERENATSSDLIAGIRLLGGVTNAAPEVTAPWIDLGIAYRRSGDLERAETSLVRALGITPDHPLAHNELGIVYRMLGRFADARSSYEQALAVYPGYHFARRNLGVLCDLYLADAACALEQYAAYLAAVPDDRQVEIWMSDVASGRR